MLPTVIFVRSCVKCAGNQIPYIHKYAIKLEKRLISYENQPLFWYAGRDSNPRPTGS